MKIVGLTGGIGSGKTTVANIFSELGVPVYVADDEAKALMNRSKVIRRKLKILFGEAAYKDNMLNKTFIADKVFNEVSVLKKMNAIVHPKVKAHFKRWLKKQKSAYVIKEVAILFETGGHEECDLVVMVTAPKEERIKRLLKRDKTTKAKVEAIMKNQWEEDKKLALSDFIIENFEPLETRKQVVKIHGQILAKTQ